MSDKNNGNGEKSEILKRKVYSFRWQKRPEKAVIFDVNYDNPQRVDINGFTFQSDMFHPKSTLILVIVDGYMLGEGLEYLASGGRVLGLETWVFENPEPAKSKGEIEYCEMKRWLLALPCNSSSLMTKPLFPSFKNSAFTIQVGKGAVDENGLHSASVDLYTCNTTH
jgi:hypothetical protein